MARRVANVAVRELLAAARLETARRWAVPGQVDGWLEALQAGQPVPVSSEQLMCAFSRTGLPHTQYAYGGRDWGKLFVLTGDRLSEVR